MSKPQKLKPLQREETIGFLRNIIKHGVTGKRVLFLGTPASYRIFLVNKDNVVEEVHYVNFLGLINAEIDSLPNEEARILLSRCMLSDFVKAPFLAAIQSLSGTDVWTSVEPAAFRFLSDPGLCYFRAAFDPPRVTEDTLEFCAPTFHEFLSRMDRPVHFCAWLYNRFLPNPYRKQVLWLMGESNSFKTTFLKTLGACFGTSFHTIDSRHLKSEYKYLEWDLRGKKLTLIEEGEPWIVQSTRFLTLTGNDSVMTDRKYQDAAEVYLQSSFAVDSNKLPALEHRDEILNRILLVKITKQKNTINYQKFVNDIRNEFSNIIGYCKTCYLQVANQDGFVDNDVQSLRDIADLDIDVPIMIFENYFEVSDINSFVSTSDIYRVLEESGIFTNKDRKEILKIWEQRFRIAPKRRYAPKAVTDTDINPKQSRGYSGLRLRNRQKLNKPADAIESHQ